MTELEKAQAIVAEKWYVEEECSCRELHGVEGYLNWVWRCDEFLHSPKCKCDGIGKVKRWPMRVACVCCQGTEGADCYCDMSGEDSCCHGTGYTPCEDALVLARVAALCYTNRDIPQGGWHIRFMVENDRMDCTAGFTVDADDLELAIFQAVAEWLEHPGKVE